MNRLSRYPLLVVYVCCFYAVYAVVKLVTAVGWPHARKSSTVKRVLFLECMGPPSAGHRHRSMGWVNELKAQGLHAECWYVIPYPRQWKLQQTENGMLRLHLIYLFKRLMQCFRSASFDAVIVRRELLVYNDYGDLFFEKWMRRMHKRLILDADDDISAAKREPRTLRAFGKFMKEHPMKFKSSLQYFDKAIVGSDYLKDLFATWNQGLTKKDIVAIPGCVDYNVRKDYSNTRDAIVLGWVGSAYSLHNLYNVYPALAVLNKRASFELLVVSNEAPEPGDFPMRYIPWSEESEVENLLKIDIGIMPLADTNVSKGKGGLKLIQYMGCGLVSVATAITINADIVNDGVNGFLVHDSNDWLRVLENVLNLKHEFQSIGQRAAETIREQYSYAAHLDTFTGTIGASVLKKESVR